MAATVWKGHLTFGLISVPVRLYVAARKQTIGFNMLHKECGSRIKQQLFCPVDEVVVERKDIQKGHEVSDGTYVIFDEDDFEKITPPTGKTIDVLEFVKLDEVDPLYFDTSYFLVPEEPGEKAYSLLQKVMEEAEYVGVAKIVLHQREHVIIIRPSEGGIMMHTMFYEDEVRSVEDYGKTPKAKITEKELAMGKMFVESLAAEFDISKYHDQYRENLKTLIEAKAEGQTVTTPEAPAVSPVMDLMAALKASLEKGAVKHASGAVEPIPIERARSKREKAEKDEDEAEEKDEKEEKKPKGRKKAG